MCGVAGLFAGCAALSFCPAAAIRGRPAAVGSGGPREAVPGARSGDGPRDTAYRSPFAGWFDNASVRAAQRRELSDADDGLFLFSPDLVPIARHPLVRSLPPHQFREVLIRHAYRYLDYTARLEHLVVNRTVVGIAHGTVALDVPEEMRFDAYKIYCDEAYHALFSADLIRQIRARTSVAPVLSSVPWFLRRLEELKIEAGPQRAALVELLFVICSETLISATLAEVPDDARVAPAVRQSVRDHARDEGRHHAYFASFLPHLWSRLDADERRFAGTVVPRLIRAFLEPDLDAIRSELAGYGLRRDDVEQVIAEVYTPQVLADYARVTSRRTVEYFARLGVLEDPCAAEAFATVTGPLGALA